MVVGWVGSWKEKKRRSQDKFLTSQSSQLEQLVQSCSDENEVSVKFLSTSIPPRPPRPPPPTHPPPGLLDRGAIYLPAEMRCTRLVVCICMYV